MARGWESKAVEDQMAQSEEDKRLRGKAELTPAQVEWQTQHEGLLLSRTRTLTSLQGACDARYRALLERTLAHVNDELARLDREATGTSTPTPAPTPADTPEA
jgi:transposase